MTGQIVDALLGLAAGMVIVVGFFVRRERRAWAKWRRDTDAMLDRARREQS